jgi:signal transduction histidine kinase
MAVTVQMQFESVVTEIYQDAFVGSSIENGTTIIQFDLRKHNFQQELGTQAKLCWHKESSHVDVHELSTFHNPIRYRFILAQGSYLDDNKQRIDFTPAIKGVSTSQHMSHSVIRLSCYLVTGCEF